MPGLLMWPSQAEVDAIQVLDYERYVSPVVEKEAVPVERVRLDNDTVTENVSVNDEVRKENIDTDGIDETRR